MKNTLPIVLITSVCAVSIAHAGGYRVSLQGQKAQGMAHAGVAMSESAEAVFFNPGAMTDIDKGEFTGSLNATLGTSVYQNEDTGASAETDSPLGTPLNAYFSQPISDDLSWGVGVYTPYGSSVEWEKDWAGSHLVNDISLAAVFIQPTLSYRINESFSVGFGPAYVTGGVEFNRNISTSLVDENGDRANVTLDASGVDAWGYNIGLLYKLSDKTQFGVNYRGEVTLEARGESAEFDNIPTSLQAAFPDTTFDADLVLPAELTIGVSHRATDKMTVAIDVNRTYWDAYEELRIEFDAPSVPTSVNPRNYHDSNIVRFGMQYDYNDSWTHRAGIYFDSSPISDGFFAPETPRNDSIGYTYGTTYRQSDKLSFDFSLLYLTFSEIDNSYDFFVDSGGVTQPFSGTYKTNAYNVGFGLTYAY
ncbi:MAG: outer membrane protein transport protein [Pseudomonadota bacterium]